jgi:hypothetical protein
MGRESAIPMRVGRKKKWRQNMHARFPEGTFERIEPILRPKEDRTDFVREAVERENGKKRSSENAFRGASFAGGLVMASLVPAP